MDRKFIYQLVLMIVILLGLPGCVLLSQQTPAISVDHLAQTKVAETMVVEQMVQTFVASTLAVSGEPVAQEPAPVEAPEVAAAVPDAAAPEPTITQSPTITRTPTPNQPMVSVSVSTNCRLGPGQQYEIVGSLGVGEQAEVVGVVDGVNYWVIRNPRRAGECWLWGQHASVVGNISNLPKRTPPPTPTPTNTPTPLHNWAGKWSVIDDDPHGALIFDNFYLTLTQNNGSVTGIYDVNGSIFNMWGTLSSDGMTLTGSIHINGSIHPVTMRLVNVNQFVGNRDNYLNTFCGFRSGAPPPSPCLGP